MDDVFGAGERGPSRSDRIDVVRHMLLFTNNVGVFGFVWYETVMHPPEGTLRVMSVSDEVVDASDLVDNFVEVLSVE